MAERRKDLYILETPDNIRCFSECVKNAIMKTGMYWKCYICSDPLYSFIEDSPRYLVCWIYPPYALSRDSLFRRVLEEEVIAAWKRGSISLYSFKDGEFIDNSYSGEIKLHIM